MDTVWKYYIPEDIEFTLDIPKDWRPLHVGLQGDTECMWVEVDQRRPKWRRLFLAIGTGWYLPDYTKGRPATYLGTIVRRDMLVKHIYYVDTE